MQRLSKRIHLRKKDEAVKNFDDVQNNMEDFKKEFLAKFQQCLQKKPFKKRDKWIKRTVKDVLNLLSERYYVTKK